jgi:hypothetical protein
MTGSTPPTDRSTHPAIARGARRPVLADEGGLALIGVLILTSMIFALGVLGAIRSRLALRIASNDLLTKQALSVAESGVDHALGLLRADHGINGFNDGFNDELGGAGVGGSLTSVGGIEVVNGETSRFREFGSHDGDGYYVRLIDNYDETDGANAPDTDVDLGVRIRSTGRVDGAERTIEVTVRAQPLFPSGLFGDEWVHFTGTADTDSYDSRVSDYPNGPGVSGNVGSNGDVELNSISNIINGDVSAGGTVTDPHGTIQGESVNGADPMALPPVSPCGPPYSGGAGIAGGEYSSATGNLRTGTPPSNITLSEGVYCFNTITLTSTRNLTVIGDVIIFVTGRVDLTGGNVINAGTPPQLQIYSSYTGDDRGVQVQGGPDARMVVYAPETNVFITGEGDYFGGAIGKTVEMRGNGTFHYDEALGMYAGEELFVSSWREVRRM